MTKLLDVVWALVVLAKWALLEKKKYEIKMAVDTSNKTNDQTPIEAELDHASLGHTTADLPSVRIEPVKDRTKH